MQALAACWHTAPELATGTFSGPVNFADGSITGIEGTIRVDFSDLTPVRSKASVASSATPMPTLKLKTRTMTLHCPFRAILRTPGLVTFSTSATAWRAKLAARYRSGFLSEVQNFDGSLSGADAQQRDDPRCADRLHVPERKRSARRTLAFWFEVFNLTNEPFVTQNDLFDAGGNEVGTFPSRHEVYGRTFNFTIRKNF